MGSDGGEHLPRDERAKQGADSRRKLKRLRRRLRRARLIPMAGLIPKHPKGLYADVIFKDGLKAHHHLRPRRWKSDPRWTQSKWVRKNGTFTEYGE